MYYNFIGGIKCAKIKLVFLISPVLVIRRQHISLGSVTTLDIFHLDQKVQIFEK
jgi:hypothetical protein